MSPLPGDELPAEEPYVAELVDAEVFAVDATPEDSSVEIFPVSVLAPHGKRAARGARPRGEGNVHSAVWSLGLAITGGISAIIAVYGTMTVPLNPYGWVAYAISAIVLAACLVAVIATFSGRSPSSGLAKGITALALVIWFCALLMTGGGAAARNLSFKSFKAKQMAQANRNRPARPRPAPKFDPTYPPNPYNRQPVESTAPTTVAALVKPLEIEQRNLPALPISTQPSGKFDLQRDHGVLTYLLPGVHPDVAPLWIDGTGERMLVNADNGPVVIRTKDFVVEHQISIPHKVYQLGQSTAGILVAQNGGGIAVVDPKSFNVKHHLSPWDGGDLASHYNSPFAVVFRSGRGYQGTDWSPMSILRTNTNQMFHEIDGNGWFCIPRTGLHKSQYLKLTSLHPAPDGKSLIGCDEAIHRFSLLSNSLVYEERSDKALSHTHAPVFFSRNGKELARLCQGSIIVQPLNDLQASVQGRVFPILVPPDFKNWAPSPIFKKFYYVDNEKKIRAIDTDGKAVPLAIDLGLPSSPIGLFAHPNGRHLLAITPGRLHWINVLPGIAGQPIAAASTPISAAPQPNTYPLMQTVEGAKHKFERIVDELNPELAPVWSRDGKRFYYATALELVSCGDNGREQVQRFHDADGSAIELAIKQVVRAGDHLVVVCGHSLLGRLLVLDPVTLDLRQRIELSSLKMCAGHPTLPHLYCLTHRDEVLVMDLEKMQHRDPLLPINAGAGWNHIAISPQGEHLLLCGKDWHVFHLAAKNAPTRTAHWSPGEGTEQIGFIADDGRHVALRKQNRWSLHHTENPTKARHQFDAQTQVLGFVPGQPQVYVSDHSQLLRQCDLQGKEVADVAPLAPTQRTGDRVIPFSPDKFIVGSKRNYWLVDRGSSEVAAHPPIARPQRPQRVEYPQGYDALRLHVQPVSSEGRLLMWIDDGRALATLSRKKGTTFAARISYPELRVTHLLEMEDGVSLAVPTKRGVWVQGQTDRQLLHAASDFSVASRGEHLGAVAAAGSCAHDQIFFTRGDSFDIEVLTLGSDPPAAPEVAFDGKMMKYSDQQRISGSQKFTRLWLTPSGTDLLAQDDWGYISRFEVAGKRLTQRGSTKARVAPGEGMLAISPDGKRMVVREAEPKQGDRAPVYGFGGSLGPEAGARLTTLQLYDLAEMDSPVNMSAERNFHTRSLALDGAGQIIVVGHLNVPPRYFDEHFKELARIESPPASQIPGAQFLPALYVPHPTDPVSAVLDVGGLIYLLRNQKK